MSSGAQGNRSCLPHNSASLDVPAVWSDRLDSSPAHASSFSCSEPELRFVLQLPPPAWEARYGPAPIPDRRKAVVFLSANGRRASQAAASAASLGYSRCLVLQGALAAYMSEAKADRRPPRCLTRHAVALLLQGQARPVANGGDSHTEAGQPAGGGGGERGGQPPVVVVDLRRHDERALYGAIQGSVHIPGEGNEEGDADVARTQRRWELQAGCYCSA